MDSAGADSGSTSYGFNAFAEKVPTCDTRQVRALALGSLTIFNIGGVIFGISALYGDLYRNGLYVEECFEPGFGMTSREQTAKICLPKLFEKDQCCQKEYHDLSLVSTIGFFIADASAAPWGEIVDRTSPFITLQIATVISISGFLLLMAGTFVSHGHLQTIATLTLVADTSGSASGSAFDGATFAKIAAFVGYNASHAASFLSTTAVVEPGVNSSVLPNSTSGADDQPLYTDDHPLYDSQGGNVADWLVSAGLVLIAMAGPGVFNGVYLGVLDLPGSTRTVFFEAITATLVAASFDLSSLVFRLIDIMGDVMTIPYSIFLWACLSAFGAWCTLYCGLHDSVSECIAKAKYAVGLSASSAEDGVAQRQLQDGPKATEATPLKASMDASADDSGVAEGPKGMLAQFCDTYWRPLMATMGTKHNLLLVAYMANLNLATSHFLTVHSEYFRVAFGNDIEGQLSSAFDILFPVLGFLASLAVSPLLVSYQQWLPWMVLSIAASLWMFLTIIPTPTTQWIAVVLFGPMRMLQWAAYYRLIGSTPSLYDESSVGRTIGYNLLLIAVLGDATNAPLASYASETGLTDQDSAMRFLVLKIIFLVLFLPLAVLLPWYLRRVMNE